MEIKVLDTEQTTKVQVVGRVDTTTAGDFQQQMEEIFAAHQQDLVIDCSQLTFLSSAGLRAFFILAKKAQAAKVDIVLQQVGDNVLEVLKISGFDGFFKIEK